MTEAQRMANRALELSAKMESEWLKYKAEQNLDEVYSKTTIAIIRFTFFDAWHKGAEDALDTIVKG